jgi:hypothetical protein
MRTVKWPTASKRNTFLSRIWGEQRGKRRKTFLSGIWRTFLSRIWGEQRGKMQRGKMATTTP